jgi:hypothetical protein
VISATLAVAVSNRFCSVVTISWSESNRWTKACNSLISGAVGFQSSGLIAVQSGARSSGLPT